jgi:ATP-dependent RNA helicase DeaD
LTFNELGLSNSILKGIEELGFHTPTPIQERIITTYFENEKDIIGLAQTGTGKTAAFALPILETIDINSKDVSALILAPTRELCIQIEKDIHAYSKYMDGISTVPIYGGASISHQMNQLKRGVNIIVATPGRMVDLINRNKAKIESIKTVVLDEADEMLNMGFREDLDAILSKTPKNKRTLLFSATMPADVAKISNKYMFDPIKITIGTKNSGAENVKHVYYQVHARDRYLVLKRIADINPDIYGIVFCRTRTETKDVAEKLARDGYSADALHGDLSQSQRDVVMKKFRDRNLQMLVATDVAARGIDVNNISHVINYNLPDALDIYTHRSGRTGRADMSGISIAIVNYREKSKLKQLERSLKKQFEQLKVPSGEEICEKQLLNMIDKMERVEVDEKQISPFMEKINQKLESLSKEDIIKKFVSIEFNRFLDYYRDAPDLNQESNKSDSRSQRSDRSQRNDRSQRGGDKKGKRRGRVDYQRFFMNIGSKIGIEPKNIIGMINDNTGDRDIKVGDIDIKDSFSFFEVDEGSAEKVIDALSNVKFKGNPVRIEPAEEDKNPRKRDNFFRNEKPKKRGSKRGRR